MWHRSIRCLSILFVALCAGLTHAEEPITLRLRLMKGESHLVNYHRILTSEALESPLEDIDVDLRITAIDVDSAEHYKLQVSFERIRAKFRSPKFDVDSTDPIFAKTFPLLQLLRTMPLTIACDSRGKLGIAVEGGADLRNKVEQKMRSSSDEDQKAFVAIHGFAFNTGFTMQTVLTMPEKPVKPGDVFDQQPSVAEDKPIMRLTLVKREKGLVYFATIWDPEHTGDTNLAKGFALKGTGSMTVNEKTGWLQNAEMDIRHFAKIDEIEVPMARMLTSIQTKDETK